MGVLRLQTASGGTLAQCAVLLAALCPLIAAAQTAEQEPIAILELGAAASRGLDDGSAGPTVAFEVTPVENWLELEAGVTSLFNRSSTEWDTDLLFKKPWTLSQKAEFMLGAGPEWVHTNKPGATANSISAEGPVPEGILTSPSHYSRRERGAIYWLGSFPEST